MSLFYSRMLRNPALRRVSLSTAFQGGTERPFLSPLFDFPSGPMDLFTVPSIRFRYYSGVISVIRLFYLGPISIAGALLDVSLRLATLWTQSPRSRAERGGNSLLLLLLLEAPPSPGILSALPSPRPTFIIHIVLVVPYRVQLVP